MMCLTCQFKLGQAVPMTLGENGTYFCQVCKTTRRAAIATPVLMVRSGISKVLFVGGFMLLLLATIVWTAFPELETPLTWTSVYSLYLIYFGLAFAQLRRKVYG